MSTSTFSHNNKTNLKEDTSKQETSKQETLPVYYPAKCYHVVSINCVYFFDCIYMVKDQNHINKKIHLSNRY